MKISGNISVGGFVSGQGAENKSNPQSSRIMVEHSRAAAAGIPGVSESINKNNFPFQSSPRSTTAQQEQSNIINELKEIDFQMKNLQDVYNKN